MTAIQRFALHGTIMNPHSSGPYVRYEDHLAAMQGRCLAQIEEPAGAAPAAVAPQGDEDDSLLLCASDLQHSAIYDSHSEMQDCARAVADRIKALAAPALEAPAAPAGEGSLPSSFDVRRALQFIHDTFKKDLDAGYRTKDKEFAVSIAAPALAAAPQAPEMEAQAANDLAQRLRTACLSVRSKSYPLSDLIPLMQQAADALAAAPQAPRLGEDALHLLHRLLSNQHTLTGPEFRAELEKIVAEESVRHAAAPQAPNCTRCSGSGEDPEGYLTHGHGPDDHTVDGPCRSCDGTGAAPQAPAAPVGQYTLVDEGLPVELAGAQAQYSIERADGSTAAWILGDESAAAELMAALRMPVSGAALAAPAAPAVDAQDAARYRWLRDTSVPPHNFYLSVPDEFKDERYTPRDVDAAIDAAIAAQAKEGGV